MKKLLILLALLSLTANSFATLNCQTGTPPANATTILEISNTINAHGAIPETGYPVKIYCTDSDSTITLSTACTATPSTIALKLSNATNAHAEIPTQTSYSTNNCIGANGAASITCESATACQSDETCLVELSDNTNAHLAQCGTGYPVKICCKTASQELPPAETCGNGTIDSGEDCEPTIPITTTCHEINPIYDSGIPTCNATCKFDLSNCQPPINPACGNPPNQLDSGEECDGTNLAGKTCQDFSFDSGTLSCTSSCTLDKSGCTIPENTCRLESVNPTTIIDGIPNNFTTITFNHNISGAANTAFDCGFNAETAQDTTCDATTCTGKCYYPVNGTYTIGATGFSISNEITPPMQVTCDGLPQTITVNVPNPPGPECAIDSADTTISSSFPNVEVAINYSGYSTKPTIASANCGDGQTPELNCSDTGKVCTLTCSNYNTSVPDGTIYTIKDVILGGITCNPPNEKKATVNNAASCTATIAPTTIGFGETATLTIASNFTPGTYTANCNDGTPEKTSTTPAITCGPYNNAGSHTITAVKADNFACTGTQLTVNVDQPNCSANPSLCQVCTAQYNGLDVYINSLRAYYNGINWDNQSPTGFDGTFNDEYCTVGGESGTCIAEGICTIGKTAIASVKATTTDTEEKQTTITIAILNPETSKHAIVQIKKVDGDGTIIATSNAIQASNTTISLNPITTESLAAGNYYVIATLETGTNCGSNCQKTGFLTVLPPPSTARVPEINPLLVLAIAAITTIILRKK